MACAEGDGSDDLKSWLSTFKHQLDSETFTCIYETLKANQFCTRLKIKLIGEEEFNLMFNKQLPLGAKALLQNQISLLREQSPLQKPTVSQVREEKGDTSAKNTGSKKNVLRALEDQEKTLQRQLKTQKEELKEVEMRIDSMNIIVREPPPVGGGKNICGYCHHRGHRNSALKPCSLNKSTEYTYCGIKEKHPEYFSQLTSLKLERKKRKDAVDQLEGQLKSMEQFSTSSEYQFIKSVTLRMYQADESYKVNKAKLMRDVRLLRECLDGKIPPVTTNDSEQIQNLILKCKRSKQIRDDDCPKSMSPKQFSPIKSTERDGDVPTGKEEVVMPVKENNETPKAKRITSEESSSSSSDDRRSKKRKKKSKVKKRKKRGSRRHHSSSDDSSEDDFGKSSRQNFSSAYFPPQYLANNSLQFMNNLYGGLPVPNNFVSRAHIPHNYSSYPVPFLPMNLQNSQTNIQPVGQMCQESSLPSANMEPEWENLETLANVAFSNANEN